VNCPSDAAQRAARWGSGVTKTEGGDEDASEVIEHAEEDVDIDIDQESEDTDGESSPSYSGTQHPETTDEGKSQSRSGGASNQYGSVLGTGTPSTTDTTDRSGNETDQPSGEARSRRNSSGSDSPESDDDTTPADASGNTSAADLTEHERRFLRNVIAALNGELDGYDLTQSMTTVRNRSGSDIDEGKLVEQGYLENPYVGKRKYYYVTEKGQRAVDRKLYTGRDYGDLHEKVHHKVFTECFARYLEQTENHHVEKYYEPMGGGMVFDVAGFIDLPGGQRNLTAIGEVVTTVKSDRVIKHYDDFAQYDGVTKHWVVKDIDVTHELVRVLRDAGRVETAPQKSLQNHTRIAEIVFGEHSKWRIHSGSDIVEAVREIAAESGGGAFD